VNLFNKEFHAKTTKKDAKLAKGNKMVFRNNQSNFLCALCVPFLSLRRLRETKIKGSHKDRREKKSRRTQRKMEGYCGTTIQFPSAPKVCVSFLPLRSLRDIFFQRHLRETTRLNEQ
jgi:hypothetical protein